MIVGYGTVNKHTRKLDTKRHPMLKKSKVPDSQASVLISNHVSICDVFYFLSTNYTPSFISRSAMAKTPLIGAFTKVIQCIFVNRLADQRVQIKEQLENRVQNIQAGKNFKSVFIFPEGTCTNGKALGQFKKARLCSARR